VQSSVVKLALGLGTVVRVSAGGMSLAGNSETPFLWTRRVNRVTPFLLPPLALRIANFVESKIA